MSLENCLPRLCFPELWGEDDSQGGSRGLLLRIRLRIRMLTLGTPPKPGANLPLLLAISTKGSRIVGVVGVPCSQAKKPPDPG